jgi:hypothetical protein
MNAKSLIRTRFCSFFGAKPVFAARHIARVFVTVGSEHNVYNSLFLTRRKLLLLDRLILARL